MGICVKNNEKTVGEAIRSIANADYPKDKMEVIVVDGMSRDGTEEMVKAGLKESDLQWMLLHDGGRGLTYARQMVFENSRGKYIIWIDGDNVIPPHFMRRHVDFMERSPNIGASGALIIPRGGSIVAKLQGYQWLIPALVETRVKKLERQSGVAVFGMQGVACRVQAMKGVGGFDMSLMGAGEDADLFVRMQLKGWKIGGTPKTWIYHCMRSDWRSLLSESIWWGYGRHYLSHKHHKTIGSLVTKRTRLMLLDIIELTLNSAKLFRDPACLLMPLHYLYRRVGFFIGFNKAHRDGYGHRYAKSNADSS